MQRVSVTLIDDLDRQSKADETVHFALDGRAYEVDLNAHNAARLRDCLKPWIEVARTPRSQNTHDEDEPRFDPADVRAWALEQGQQVSRRGRLPKGLIRDYVLAKRHA